MHQLTGDPCHDPVDTKSYECFHKAHGYGGYDLYFLGTTLESMDFQLEGVDHLLKSVTTDHHLNDGHIANTATVIEAALESDHKCCKEWAEAFGGHIQQRLSTRDEDDACQRLVNMKIPRLRTVLGSSLFGLPYFQRVIKPVQRRQSASAVEEENVR